MAKEGSGKQTLKLKIKGKPKNKKIHHKKQIIMNPSQSKIKQKRKGKRKRGKKDER